MTPAPDHRPPIAMGIVWAALVAGTIALPVVEPTLSVPAAVLPLAVVVGSVLVWLLLGRGTAARASTERVARERDRDALAGLAGGIAHHVNNALTAIMGHAELAWSGLRPDAPARADVDAIRSISEDLAELSRQVLAVAGRGGVAVREVDLNEVVEEHAGDLRASLPDGVTLDYQLARGLPAVTGDPAQVADALLHLVRHAGRLAGPGAPVVVRSSARQIGAERLAAVVGGGVLAPGTYVALGVTAPGPVPDPEVVDAWFTPFATGLALDAGLALPAVLGIARGHRGGVEVDAAPGAGTTITVLLPAAPIAAASAA